MMPITVNGASLRSVDGNNTRSVSAATTGAPELDYLQFNASVPAVLASPRADATATGRYSVKLTWPEVADAQLYNVYKSGSSAPLALGLTSSNLTDSTILVANTTNTYTVQAVNQGGTSTR